MAYMLELLHLTLFVAWSSAQAPQNPITDFCRRYGQQTAVIDRSLYIDGGWVYANPLSQNPIPTISTYDFLPSNRQVLTLQKTKTSCTAISMSPTKECQRNMRTYPRTTLSRAFPAVSCGQTMSIKSSGCTAVNFLRHRALFSFGDTMSY